MNRREFLKDSLIFAGGLAAAKLAPRIDLSPEPEKWLEKSDSPESLPLSKEQACNFALKLRYIMEEIGPYVPEPPKTLQEAQKFVDEVYPYYNYEGINTGKWYGNGSIFIPEATEKNPVVREEKMPGSENFHVLGYAECRSLSNDGQIAMNERFFNEYAPWYKNWLIVSTLVHEVGHFQGLCNEVPNTPAGDIETATQLGMTEVMMSMFEHGNRYTLLAALGEISGFAEDYALGLAMNDKDWSNWYRDNFVAKLPNRDMALMRYDQSYRAWDRMGIEGIKDVVQRYGADCYKQLVYAMNSPYGRTEELPVSNMGGTIEMNSTKYVLSHLNELKEAYKKLE